MLYYMQQLQFHVIAERVLENFR